MREKAGWSPEGKNEVEETKKRGKIIRIKAERQSRQRGEVWTKCRRGKR